MLDTLPPYTYYTVWVFYMGVLRIWPWNKDDWRERCVRGVGAGGTPPSREHMAFGVLTLYSVMNVLHARQWWIT